MTSDSTIDIRLDNRKPWIQARTLRPELDHSTGRHFDTPLRLVTSRPSFRQTRHLASHNISTIVHGTSKFRYTWRESWCNCARNALHADRGRVISLPRERELLDTFGVEFDSGSTPHLFDTRDLTAWSQQYRDDKCTKQLYSVWIFPVNYKGIMNRHAHRIDQSTYVLTGSWEDLACGVGGQCCWTLS